MDIYLALGLFAVWAIWLRWMFPPKKIRSPYESPYISYSEPKPRKPRKFSYAKFVLLSIVFLPLAAVYAYKNLK